MAVRRRNEEDHAGTRVKTEKYDLELRGEMASEPIGAVSLYKQAPTDRLWWLTLPKPLPA